MTLSTTLTEKLVRAVKAGGPVTLDWETVKEIIAALDAAAPEGTPAPSGERIACRWRFNFPDGTSSTWVYGSPAYGDTVSKWDGEPEVQYGYAAPPSLPQPDTAGEATGRIKVVSDPRVKPGCVEVRDHRGELLAEFSEPIGQWRILRPALASTSHPSLQGVGDKSVEVEGQPDTLPLKPLPDADDSEGWTRLAKELEDKADATSRALAKIAAAKRLTPKLTDELVYGLNTARNVERYLLEQISDLRKAPQPDTLREAVEACGCCKGSGTAPWIMGDYLRPCGYCEKGKALWASGIMRDLNGNVLKPLFMASIDSPEDK